ncbi:alpha/beta hydrolase [Streptomyces sp. NPDC047108]|uniref:alpha/beta fold hydrolase n=1 Tax=Streptomyces sp. NPDC047108 TaxID=3155025 RepID=UPI003401ED75
MAMIHTAGDGEGVRLHVQRMTPEDRPPVATAVLTHGLLNDSLANFYFTIAPPLAAAGVDVVMFDHRGHGRSERPPTGYRLENFADDMELLIDRLEITGPLHLVGNCFGGTVAFEYALRHPERTASVFLIESKPATTSWSTEIAWLLDQAVPALSDHEDETLAWVTETLGPQKARLARMGARLVQNTSLATDIVESRVLTDEMIGSVRCPVSALYGSESTLATQREWLESRLPQTRTILAPGHNHEVLADAPALVLPHVLSAIVGPVAAQGALIPGDAAPGELAQAADR